MVSICFNIVLLKSNKKKFLLSIIPFKFFAVLSYLQPGTIICLCFRAFDLNESILFKLLIVTVVLEGEKVLQQ